MSEKEHAGGHVPHEHDENCDCDHETETVFITFEDDREVECNIIGVFEYDNKEYIAINPVDDDEILIYHYDETENGEAIINFIEDDAEYESVTGEFYKLFEEDPDDLTEYDDFYLEEDDEDDDEDFEDEEI